MKKKIYSFAVLILTGLMISRGEDAILYAKDAMYLCFDIIIPSLFPFFICSGLLIYSGFCESISKIFAPVMKPLFNVNPNGSSAFVLGIISGYPLGAITACQLYESNYISKTETERLLAFCNNSGPLFLLGSVGIGLYMGLDIGIILYTAHILGALLVGICMRFYSADKYHAPDYSLNTEEISFAEGFRTSTVNAVNNILLVCGTIIFFSVASRLILGIIPYDIPPLVYGLFEFSGGNVMVAASPAPLELKLIMASIITGFAGLSVHMQVLAVCAKHKLSMKPYILGKIMHGVFSGSITAVILKLSGYAPAFSNIAAPSSAAFVMASAYTIISICSIGFLLLLLKLKKAA